MTVVMGFGLRDDLIVERRGRRGAAADGGERETGVPMNDDVDIALFYVGAGLTADFHYVR